MEKRAFEQTGLVPRSIIRTFDRFRRQLLKGAETSVIQEFRVSRYQVLVSVKCLVSLLIIPLVVNFLAKTFFLMPLTEYLWNTQQNEIFLNLYQENRAFAELHDFEEKLFFESLIETQSAPEKRTLASNEKFYKTEVKNNTNILYKSLLTSKTLRNDVSSNLNDATTRDTKNYECAKRNNCFPRSSSGNYLLSGVEPSKQAQLTHSLPLSMISQRDARNKPSVSLSATMIGQSPIIVAPRATMIEDGSFYLENSLPQKFQQKTIELAVYYNQQSIEAITNLFGDFITFITISFLFIWMEPQIIILKSFLTESIYSLSDTTKSFLLILLTDLLVGFHSPRGWEIFIELILRHFGLPENQDFIFLFVATFPVLLDTVFKYWIFRYLNQISPSTVATYHSMIE